MKTLVKKISIIIIMFICFISFTACDDGKKELKFDAANYVFDKTYTYESTLTLSNAITALNSALEKTEQSQAYSYDQTIKGHLDGVDYTYTGATKIDLTGETPKASLVLNGEIPVSMYIKDGMAYVQYNENKFSFEADGDLDDVISKLSVEIQFEMNSIFDISVITSETFIEAGIDKAGATIIKYGKSADDLVVTIVINDGKLMVVLSNQDSIKTRCVYNYTASTITFPNDLNDYELLQ